MYRAKLVSFVFILISVFSIIYSAVCLSINGNNCTQEFTTYKELKGVTKKEELISYLQEKELSYTIDDNVLKINDFDHFSFIITGSSCEVKKTNFIEALEELDTKDPKEVHYEETFDSGKTSTKYSCSNEGYTACLIGENYYIHHSLAIFWWMIVSIVVCIISIIVFCA